MLDSKRKYWLLYVAWVGIIMTSPMAHAVGPGDAEEWAAKTPISVSITAPADNTYVPINHTQSLTATASDTDCYRVGTTWYDYSDDVTSGNSPTDYHMSWTASTGSFTDTYGTSATYQAPDYSAGNNVRDVTVSAHADDINRGADTYGYGETAQQHNVTLKVWQVTVTASQAGTKSGNDDADNLPAYCGGTTHGWIIHGTPAGSKGYYGNTEIMGSIPEGPDVTTGYTWSSYYKGVVKYKSDETWHDLMNHDDWTPDGPYDYYDLDSRHPNATGTDVRQIFMQDAPGFKTEAGNDYGIGKGWTDLSWQFDYKSEAKYGFICISNEILWEVKYVLDVVAGKWHVVGDHTP